MIEQQVAPAAQLALAVDEFEACARPATARLLRV
jgi:hypothetical protein